MTQPLVQLKAALERRLQVVADHTLRDSNPQKHMEALKDAAAALEDARAALPTGTDSRLLHFLERQSYLKALDWLKERGY